MSELHSETKVIPITEGLPVSMETKLRFAVACLITDIVLIINAGAVSPAAADTLAASVALVEEALQ